MMQSFLLIIGSLCFSLGIFTQVSSYETGSSISIVHSIDSSTHEILNDQMSTISFMLPCNSTGLSPHLNSLVMAFASSSNCRLELPRIRKECSVTSMRHPPRSSIFDVTAIDQMRLQLQVKGPSSGLKPERSPGLAGHKLGLKRKYYEPVSCLVASIQKTSI